MYTKDVKSIVYLSLVRPILEYSSPIWDPYLLADIQSIEKFKEVQPDGCYLIIVGLLV